jgi:hypothetical protein
MGNQVTLLLIGGLISLVSTLAATTLQHWFDLQKKDRETRQHLTQILYSKQTRFYDKAAQILSALNGYITTVNVLLGETGQDPKRMAAASAQRVQRAASDLNDLMESYWMYLPAEVLKAGNALFMACVFLSRSPKVEQTDTCMNALLSLQNTIRLCTGVDKISSDLLRALGTQAREKDRQGEKG